MKKLLCIAHRGASGHEPENTLLAVGKALVLGADWIEIDVYAVEGELVVIHDDKLERTTNGSGDVISSSLRYLRSLDAGKGQRIPFLREIFDLANRETGINVELKGNGTAEPAVSLIDDYVSHRGWHYDQIIVSSFHYDQLVQLRKLQPKIRIGVLVDEPISDTRFVEEMGAYSVHFRLKHINRALVCDAHKRDLKVFVFTVNNLKDIERMVQLGVDGVFTNYPERVVGF
jgi:glycerophosphoryl diester phosphodiesterase